MSLSSRRRLLLAFGMAGLAIAVISISDMFTRRPSDGIAPSVYGLEGVLVRSVARGSGAEAAGIRPGDVIVGINGRMVKSPHDASRELLRHRIGQSAPYLIERGRNNLVTVRVSFSGVRIGDPTYLYEATIGFLFFFIGLFVFVKRPDDDSVSLFFVLCVLFLLFFVCRLRPSSYWWIDLFVQNTGTISLFLLPAVFLHFFLVFPRPTRFRFADAKDDFSLPAPRLLRGLQSFLNGSPALFLLIYSLPPIFSILDFYRQMTGRPVRQLSGAPLSGWVLLGDYLVLGLAALAHSAFTLETRRERRQVFEVFFGTILGTAPFLVFGIIFPSAFHNDAYVFYGIAPMILIPLTFAYAIVRFQLLNVRVIVRRSLLYTATTVIIFALYAGAMAAANSLFGRFPLSSSRLFAFGFFLVVIPLFEFLRRKLQTPIDKLFFREKFDYRKAMLEVSEAVAGELSLARVADYLTARVISAMRLSGAEIFLRDRDGALVSRERREQRLSHGASVRGKLRATAQPHDVAELAADGGGDEESREFLAGLAANGFRLLSPIVYRSRLMGVLALKSKLSEEDFDRDDRLFLETLANQAATAIETAFLHDEMTHQAEFRRDLEIARDIQMSLFPRDFPRLPGLRFAGGSLPAKIVGGDFYDFLPFEGGSRLGFVMGDVSGKSIPASLLMVASREILFAGSRAIEDPGELFRASNERIYAIKRKMFVALGYFLIDPVSLSMRYAIGGQPLPILLRPGDGGPRLIEPPCYRLPLGALREVPYDTREVYLSPGDLVFFYTDGLTEAMNPENEPYGEERLMASLARSPSDDLDETVRRILADVRAHVGGAEQYDDMTFMLMRVGTGPETETRR
jgi:serine phosphatase RsbU (regulator of sigma subunit)